MIFRAACPILPSRDLGATFAFYQRLGFRRFGGEYPDYLMINRDGLELHFFLHEGLKPEENAHGAYLRVDHAGMVAGEWGALGLPLAGIPRFVGVEDKPWGMRECAVLDPDGNLLRVGQML